VQEPALFTGASTGETWSKAALTPADRAANCAPRRCRRSTLRRRAARMCRSTLWAPSIIQVHVEPKTTPALPHPPRLEAEPSKPFPSAPTNPPTRIGAHLRRRRVPSLIQDGSHKSDCSRIWGCRKRASPECSASHRAAVGRLRLLHCTLASPARSGAHRRAWLGGTRQATDHLSMRVIGICSVSEHRMNPCDEESDSLPLYAHHAPS
jgi:hypothetical protein